MEMIQYRCDYCKKLQKPRDVDVSILVFDPKKSMITYGKSSESHELNHDLRPIFLKSCQQCFTYDKVNRLCNKDHNKSPLDITDVSCDELLELNICKNCVEGSISSLDESMRGTYERYCDYKKALEFYKSKDIGAFNDSELIEKLKELTVELRNLLEEKKTLLVRQCEAEDEIIRLKKNLDEQILEYELTLCQLREEAECEENIKNMETAYDTEMQIVQEFILDNKFVNLVISAFTLEEHNGIFRPGEFIFKLNDYELHYGDEIDWNNINNILGELVLILTKFKHPYIKIYSLGKYSIIKNILLDDTYPLYYIEESTLNKVTNYLISSFVDANNAFDDGMKTLLTFINSVGKKKFYPIKDESIIDDPIVQRKNIKSKKEYSIKYSKAESDNAWLYTLKMLILNVKLMI